MVWSVLSLISRSDSILLLSWNTNRTELQTHWWTRVWNISVSRKCRLSSASLYLQKSPFADTSSETVLVELGTSKWAGSCSVSTTLRLAGREPVTGGWCVPPAFTLLIETYKYRINVRWSRCYMNNTTAIHVQFEIFTSTFRTLWTAKSIAMSKSNKPVLPQGKMVPSLHGMGFHWRCVCPQGSFWHIYSQTIRGLDKQA